MTTVADIVDVLDTHYPPRLAQSWDSVGLVCGDPADTVTSVLVCVDVTDAVVDAVIAQGIDLVVAHHPLLLRGVDSVSTDTPKGRIVHRLIRSGAALFTAHTNADSAANGVSDALAEVLGVTNTVPLEPECAQTLDSWTVFIPANFTAAVTDAMFRAGAGHVGNYSCCSYTSSGNGQFLPDDGADPYIGTIGELTQTHEERVEVVAPSTRRNAVAAALRAAHPYEEPACHVVQQAPIHSDEGLGRIGTLTTPTTLRAFTELVASALCVAPWGIRAAGDPDSHIATVAVCGGAGDSLLRTADAVGADVFVTADLRHHPVDEHIRAHGCAVIDAGHWATEFPWCSQAAQLIAEYNDTLTVRTFDQPTDPFTIHAGGSANSCGHEH